MKSFIIRIIYLLGLSLIAIPVLATNGNNTIAEEKENIKKLFEETYLEVMCRKGDPEILRKGFHPEFHMYVYYQGEISVSTFEYWMTKLIQNRGKGRNNRWNFKNIEITGTTAMVQLEVFEDDKLTYTDFFTLYKLENGWKVFAKAFTIH